MTCPVCNRDDNHYLKCNRPDCTDGRHVPTLRNQAQRESAFKALDDIRYRAEANRVLKEAKTDTDRMLRRIFAVWLVVAFAILAGWLVTGAISKAVYDSNTEWTQP